MQTFRKKKFLGKIIDTHCPTGSPDSVPGPGNLLLTLTDSIWKLICLVWPNRIFILYFKCSWDRPQEGNSEDFPSSYYIMNLFEFISLSKMFLESKLQTTLLNLLFFLIIYQPISWAGQNTSFLGEKVREGRGGSSPSPQNFCSTSRRGMLWSLVL